MKKIFAFLVLSWLCKPLSAQVYKATEPLVHTFSIVARDSATGQMAVGVQSHWFSVGTAVSWGESGTGVVATQSFVDKSYGTKGLALMKQGFTAKEALDSLLKADPGREVRQVAFIDNKGTVAAHTGKACIQYASDIQGDDFSVQSNMMLGNKVCEGMAAAFRAASGKPLAERVLAALDGGQSAGGDIRGMQSAVLIVVDGKTADAWNDKLTDIRVDDNARPLKELRRLYNLQMAYQHMNNGDLAAEKNDVANAMREYGAAMKMFPDNLEMQYWTAIMLVNSKKINEALPMLKKIFVADKNWKELTKRLGAAGLLSAGKEDLEKIMQL